MPHSIAPLGSPRAYAFVKRRVIPRLIRGTVVRVEGLERIPVESGAVLVGNHRCDLDPSIVMSAVPDPISWLAAGYMARVPIVGWMQRRVGAIHIGLDVRGRSYRERAVDHLMEGGLLGVFPEGHDYILQNDFSAPMKPFHPGFAEFALAASVAVVPFAIVAESERLVPFKVPRAVQRLSGWPEEVVRGVTQKVRYESVCVSFGKAIDRSTSLDALIRETRSAIEGLVSSPAE